jgi:hypothetical protein
MLAWLAAGVKSAVRVPVCTGLKTMPNSQAAPGAKVPVKVQGWVAAVARVKSSESR